MLGGLGMTKTRSRAVSYSHHLYIGDRACTLHIVSHWDPLDGCSCSPRKDADYALSDVMAVSVLPMDPGRGNESEVLSLQPSRAAALGSYTKKPLRS